MPHFIFSPPPPSLTGLVHSYGYLPDKSYLLKVRHITQICISDAPTGRTHYIEYRAFLIWDLDSETVPHIKNVGPFVAAAVKMGLRSF